MKTVDGVWKPTQNVQIQLSQENLNQWPEEGDLATLNPALHIMERDEAGEIVMDVENTDGNTDINQNTSNINDEGPAPLQMGNRPLETFDGVINHNDSSIARCANAELAISEITEVIERIHERGDVEQDGDANLNNDPSEANDIATFQQTDVLPIDGFANMNKTPYAWSRAFPTVFIPEYRIIDNEWKWVICHDITGWLCVRENEIPTLLWYEHIIWRSDGIPAAHPTFSLVLYNHKVKNQLQKQGRFVLNMSEVDANIYLDKIRDAPTNQALRKEVDKVIETARSYAGNIPGTKPYWTNKYFEFKATNMYNSYMCKKDPTLFHSGSIAEYHEYFLRMTK